MMIDQEGWDTLDSISVADKFNQWMYKTIEPYCKGNTLEIGSGTGNISQFFIKNKQPIHLTDLRQNYVAILTKKFDADANNIPVSIMDIADSNFDEKFKHLFETFDTIFALNVIEHIQDDKQAILNCKKLLKHGGTLIILVPAYMALHNSFDKALEHYRRYTKKSLQQLFSNSQLLVKHTQYFNAFGIVGWWLMGNVFKKKIIPKEQMKLYNTLMPFIKFTDTLVINKLGLSVICIGEK